MANHDMQQSPESGALLTEVQAAKFVCLSVRTLQAWRSRRTGPPFIRAGRAIRYRRADLVDWADKSTVRFGSAPGGVPTAGACHGR